MSVVELFELFPSGVAAFDQLFTAGRHPLCKHGVPVGIKIRSRFNDGLGTALDLDVYQLLVHGDGLVDGCLEGEDLGVLGVDYLQIVEGSTQIVGNAPKFLFGISSVEILTVSIDGDIAA